MNPVFTFTEEYEREMAVANREFDIAMTEASMMAQHTADQLKVNMALSELKVMNENGTAEDLADLILEAGEEAAQENQGTLSKVFTAIGNFFTRLFNSIQKVFTGKNTAKYNELVAKNAKVQVDSTTPNLMKALQEAMPMLDSAGKDTNGFTKKILAIVGGGAATAAAIFGVWKVSHKFRKDGEAQSTVEVDAKTAMAWKDQLAQYCQTIGKFFTEKGHQLANWVTGRAKKDKQAAEQHVSNTGAVPGSAETDTTDQKMTKKERKAEQKKWTDTADAQETERDGFLGSYNMFEAGESTDGGNVGFKLVLNFVQSMCSSALNQITAGLNKAIGNVANAVQGAVTGQNTSQQQNQTSGFLGDVTNESTGLDDIDPIEAMLSGMAFGGSHA